MESLERADESQPSLSKAYLANKREPIPIKIAVRSVRTAAIAHKAILAASRRARGAIAGATASSSRRNGLEKDASAVGVA